MFGCPANYLLRTQIPPTRSRRFPSLWFENGQKTLLHGQGFRGGLARRTAETSHIKDIHRVPPDSKRTSAGFDVSPRQTSVWTFSYRGRIPESWVMKNGIRPQKITGEVMDGHWHWTTRSGAVAFTFHQADPGKKLTSRFGHSATSLFANARLRFGIECRKTGQPLGISGKVRTILGPADIRLRRNLRPSSRVASVLDVVRGFTHQRMGGATR